MLPGIEMLFGTELDARWKQVTSIPMRDMTGAIIGAISSISDIDVLKRSQAMLRENDERQTFLLKLSDALRPIENAEAVANLSCRVLVEHLNASRAQYAVLEGEPGAEIGEIGGEYVRAGIAMPRRFPLAPYGDAVLNLLRAGKSLVLNDSETDPRLTYDVREAFRAVEATATVSVPLIKRGYFVAALTIHDRKPRNWTDLEVAVVEQVADRTWAAIERARAETALRAREIELARVQRIGQVGGVNIEVTGGLRSSRSPEYLRLHGIPEGRAEESHDEWLARLHPEDREQAERVLFDALNGKGSSYENEYRIVRPSDGEVRWIHARADIERTPDGKATRLVGAHLDVTEQRNATERQSLLTAELQHRVRNILANIRAVIGRTQGEDTEEFRAHLEGRISALARTQAQITRSPGEGIDLEMLIRDELLAQAADEKQFSLVGTGIRLPPKAAEVVTLAIHELATNATKYGALAHERGRIHIKWGETARESGPWFVLTWSESGVPIGKAVPDRKGFGTELVTRRIPYELGGSGTMDFTPAGLRTEIAFPLRDLLSTEISPNPRRRNT